MPRVIGAVFAEARRGEHNLAPNHFRILRALSNGTCTLSELATAMEVSAPSMSASVQTLVARGWLERKRSASDRRVTELSVSPLGQQVLQEEYERVAGWTAKLLEKLNAQDIRKVEEGLDAFQQLFKDEVLPREAGPPDHKARAGGLTTPRKRKTRLMSR